LVILSNNKSVIAKALGIERKNIYRVSKIDLKDQKLAEEIKSVHIDNPSYGHRRIAIELNINHKRILRVMNKYGIKPPRRKTKNKYFCTRLANKHNYTNLINNLIPNHPNELWCSDVSFIKFHGRLLYLSTIEDVFTRRVIAAQIGIQHDKYLVYKTLKEALDKATPEIFHSDQGTEFMAKICTDYLENKGIKISVSDKSSPWQNGYQESFFGRFKDEFGDFNRFDNIGELIEEIYSQIYYYNYKRIHTSLKTTPISYSLKFSE